MQPRKHENAKKEHEEENLAGFWRADRLRPTGTARSDRRCCCGDRVRARPRPSVQSSRCLLVVCLLRGTPRLRAPAPGFITVGRGFQPRRMATLKGSPYTF